MASIHEEDVVQLNQQEERELKRVFDYLANYLPKSRIQIQLQPKLDRRSTMQAHKKSTEAIKVYDRNGKVMSEAEIDAEWEILQQEIHILQEKIDSLTNEAGKTIKAADLNEALKALGKKMTKREIEDMIWEVDENLDECVDWAEFKLTFQRNISDKSGLEPATLFNIIQFLVYDKDFSGTVSVDETMSMLYARYGKDKLESQMKKLFGEDLKTADGDGELSFSEYLDAVAVQVEVPTAKNYKPPPATARFKTDKKSKGSARKGMR